MYAHRAAGAIAATESLRQGPRSLANQSICDARGEKHQDGWGLAWYEGGRPLVRKSLGGATGDPQFEELSRSVASPLLIGHIRQASVGSASLANTHPFIYGSWMFAHNGTLEGFDSGRDRLLAATPPHLRSLIQGQTDSEHVFYFWLGLLNGRLADPSQPASAADLQSTLSETVRTLDEWFPTVAGEDTRMNFLVSDGRLLAATRWKHTLYRRGGIGVVHAAEGQNTAAAIPAVFIASEPTTDDAWTEIPDRSVIAVDEQLQVHAAGIC